MTTKRMRALAIVAGGALALAAFPALTVAQEAEDAAWQPDPACQSDDPVVQEAIANTVSRTGPQTEWHGPAEGPAPREGASVVWLLGDATNAIAVNWGNEIEKVSALLGWEYQSIDGQGTAQGWIDGMTQAIALQPDVIMTTADARTLTEKIGEANEQGIVVIGIHGTALPGPSEETGLFSNITSDPRDIGAAMADYLIARSCGTARSIVLFDSVYEIAQFKGEAMRDRLLECEGCELLEYVDSPLSELTTRQPQLCTNWAVQYGTGWSGMTIYDDIWNFCTPSLENAGLSPTDVTLIASDGTEAGYARIREGQYQVATVPEPAELQAYMAVDDAIRAMAGEPPAGWDQPVFIHFSDGAHGDNLAIEGGDRGQFFPSNDYVDHYLSLWGVESAD
jgi:ribose transport system substrate-binding protein